MRVITGTAKGKRLVTPNGSDLVRPTSEKVKEAVFSAIQFDIEGRRILDLFAGSGQLGIEALSRGAKSAVFVDASAVSVDIIKKNLITTELSEKARVIRSDFSTFLASNRDSFDIAFLDPPYNAGVLPDALSKASAFMSDYGVIVCEHDIQVVLPEKVNDFSISRTYKYGKIAVTLYRKERVS